MQARFARRGRGDAPVRPKRPRAASAEVRVPPCIYFGRPVAVVAPEFRIAEGPPPAAASRSDFRTRRPGIFRKSGRRALLD